MSDSRFNAELDALTRGEAMSSSGELTQFVAELYGEEHNMTMPQTVKLRVAGDLGLASVGEATRPPAPISRRTARAAAPPIRSGRPWAIALTIAAAVLLALTGVLRWGMPVDNNDENRFLMLSPAVPTVEATPAATESSDSIWLEPYTNEECPEDEILVRDHAGATSSRQDEPYGAVDSVNAVEVVTRQRQLMSCLDNEGRETATNFETGTDLVERSKTLSAYVEHDLGLTAEDLIRQHDGFPGPTWEPKNAVLMADGRVALIPGWLVTTDETQPSYSFFTPVWIEVGGEWLLDEELFFCIGDCDDYWSQLEMAFSGDTTPEAELSWLTPITPEECVTEDSDELPEASGEDFDRLPHREYNIVGPANPVDANAANKTARQLMACDHPASLYSDRLILEFSLAGEDFSPYTAILLEQQYVDGIALSTAFEEQGATPADFAITVSGDNPDFVDVPDGEYFITDPTHALMLDDSRIVVPSVRINVNQSAISGNRNDQAVVSTASVYIQEDGIWKLDAQAPICIGSCDAVFTELNNLYQDALWLRPISTDECVANEYLPADLSDEASAAVRSRQYRACEQSGDASSLQGSAFHVTEAADAQPLSEEIGTLHRQNREHPGSLQRIVNPTQMPPELDWPTDPWNVFQPGSAVELEDGRVAVLETSVTPSEALGTSTGRTNPVIATALIWTVDGDQWLLDEKVTVCLGNCASFWGDSVVGTPVVESEIDGFVIPEHCEETTAFLTDFTSDPRIGIGIHPGPGRGTGLAVATLPAGTPLQYMCESGETTNPTRDRMDEGKVWLKVQTEEGTEGWIREVDVQLAGPD